MEREEKDFCNVSQVRENYAVFYSKIHQYFEEGKLTDVMITCGDSRQFWCHRVVLAAASEYFEKMFSGCWKESQSTNVVLPRLDGTAFERVLQFTYEGRVVINNENVYSLLCVSDELGMATLENLCLRYLTEREIPMNYALDLFSFACATNKNSLMSLMSQFILNHLEQFHEHEDRLANLNFIDLKKLLTYWRPLSSRRERLLWNILIHWMTLWVADGIDKKSLLAGLTQTFPFRNIPEDIIERCSKENRAAYLHAPSMGVQGGVSKPLAIHVYVRDIDSCNLFVLKTTEDNVDWYPPVKIGHVEGEMKIVVVDDRLYSYSIQQVDERRLNVAFDVHSSACLSDKQSLGIPMDLVDDSHAEYDPSEDIEGVSICSDPISSKIYLHHSFPSQFATNLFAYDCEINKWFPLYNGEDNAKVSTMTYLDGRLYTIGSENNVVKAYDQRAGKWEELARTSWYHNYWDKCCCHKGKIYASYEMETVNNVEGCEIEFEVYDPVANRWSTLASIPRYPPMSYLGWLISFENKLWLFGESEEVAQYSGSYVCDYYIQRYDSFLEKWGKWYSLLEEKDNSVIDITVFQRGR